MNNVDQQQQYDSTVWCNCKVSRGGSNRFFHGYLDLGQGAILYFMVMHGYGATTKQNREKRDKKSSSMLKQTLSSLQLQRMHEYRQPAVVNYNELQLQDDIIGTKSSQPISN